MRHAPLWLAGAMILAGCGPGAAAPVTGASATEPSQGAAVVPQACHLLADADVTGLMGGGRIIKVDEADATDTRHGCLWQLGADGDLYLDVALTGPAEFAGAMGDASAVPGVGDAAYRNADHLVVRYGGYALDVYVHQNLGDAALQDRETRIAGAVAAALPH